MTTWEMSPETLSLGDVEKEFRASLPSSTRRATTVRETSLEYRKLLKLRSRGHHLSPAIGTLLGDFATIAEKRGGPAANLSNESGCLTQYNEVFGVAAPYPWHSTTAQSAFPGPTAPQPAGP